MQIKTAQLFCLPVFLLQKIITMQTFNINWDENSDDLYVRISLVEKVEIWGDCINPKDPWESMLWNYIFAPMAAPQSGMICAYRRVIW